MKKFLLVLVCLVLAGLFLFALDAYLRHQPPDLLAEAPVHGTSFVIEVNFTQVSGDTNVLNELKESLGRRFAKFGTQIYWEPVSGSRFRVMVPKIDSGKTAVAGKLISQGGHLEFRLAHTNSEQLIASGELPVGYELLVQEATQVPPGRIAEKVVVKKDPETGLAGNIIKKTMVIGDHFGKPEINFVLTAPGTAAFAEVTRSNIGRRLAIVLDGDLYSAPVIQSSIESGSGQITGSFDGYQALLLTASINYPLPAPVAIAESKSF